MQATQQQLAVLDHVRSGRGHALVEATAGSGKTTTLTLVAHELVSNLGVPPGTVAFLAFNRSAADELRRRLPAGVHASTLHSLGRSVIARADGDVVIDEGKYAALLAASGVPAEAVSSLADLARFARLDVVAPSMESVAQLSERYAVELPSGPEVCAAALATVLELGARRGPCDFTDLIWSPTIRRLPVPSFAFVCVDEAQDLSRLALTFVLRLVAAGARALFVGDPHQSIYGFAGADAGSLDRIAAATSAVRLPLSVSFRCPSRHVVLARRFSPDMTPRPGAARGKVRVTPLRSLPTELEAGDLVLARSNAPLLDVALPVAGHGRPVAVLGEELRGPAESLVARLSSGAGSLDPEAVRRSLDLERRRIEREHATSLSLPHLLEASRSAHVALAIAVAAARSRSVVAVAAAIQDLFPDALGTAAEAAVLLSTVHKAKGREAPRVFLLFPEELAASESSPDDALAEGNVLFVALTRAKADLVFVERRPGSLAARLRSGHRGSSTLARAWDGVLGLASTMASEG